MPNSESSNIRDKFSNSRLIHCFKLNARHPISLNTYEFKHLPKNENILHLCIDKNPVFAFLIKKMAGNNVDLYLKFPAGFKCIHYVNNRISKVRPVISDQHAHLSYHGKIRKKKLSGEIHIKNKDNRVGGDVQNYLESPLLTHQDLNQYPMPVCKLYFNKNISPITSKHDIYNYLDIDRIPHSINTVDVYLSKKECFERILRCQTKIDYLLGLILYYTSLNMFAKGQLGWDYELDNRLSDFVRIYCLPCNDLKLLIILSDDKRISSNLLNNMLLYFKTKNFLENILDRYVVEKDNTFYIGVSKGRTPLVSNWKKLADLQSE